MTLNAAPSDGHTKLEDELSAEYEERFKKMTASPLFGLFGGSFFDQFMMPEISAAVEWTGRFRNEFWTRGLRTAASGMLMLHANDADMQAECERLQLMHRDVKGVGPDGVRFSALNPEQWNWTLISGAMGHQLAYTAVTGEVLSDAERQLFWEFLLRTKYEHLQLPGKSSKVPKDWSEVSRYYDEFAEQRLITTATSKNAVENLQKLPFPPFLPAVAKPVWPPLAYVLGRVMATCSFGIMRPRVRELTEYKWTRRNDIEFRVITKILPIAYKHLPRRLNMMPTAYNLWRYEKSVRFYNKMAEIDSFAADPR